VGHATSAMPLEKRFDRSASQTDDPLQKENGMKNKKGKLQQKSVFICWHHLLLPYSL